MMVHGYRRKAKTDEEKDRLPSVIAVKPTDRLKAIIPSSVWRQGPFKWMPVPFAPESDRFNDRIIESVTQDRSLLQFMDDATRPVLYGVTGNPDDSKAKLFAACLVKIHLAQLGNDSNPIWHVIYGGYDNPLLKEFKDTDSKSEPTLLVLSNLTSQSTSVKLEKTRDLLERFSDIPRIIVAAGEDPLSFLFTRLNVPCNALAYFSEKLIRQRVEII